MLGMDIEKDVLGSLGDEWGVYTSPEIGGSGIIGMAVVNKLRDPAKADKALAGLADVANKIIAQQMKGQPMKVQFAQTKAGDLTVHYLAIPFVVPAWAVKGNNLYIGLYPQVVVSAAGQGKAGGKSILDNPAYQALRTQLAGTHAPSSMEFLDLPKTAPEGYQGVLMISRLYMGMADMFGIQSPPLLLPPLDKLLPHMEPAGSFSWSDAAGWHMRGMTPFPGAEMLATQQQMMVGEVALMTSILLPALNSARERAQRIKCGSNLRQIGVSVMIYATDNGGKYPPDLGTLVTATDLPAGVFVCPSGNTPPPPPGMKPADAAAWVNAHSDYIYLGAGKKNGAIGGNDVLAYEKPGAHGGQGMEVLYGDGHVDWVTAAQSQQLMGIEKKTEQRDVPQTRERPDGKL